MLMGEIPKSISNMVKTDIILVEKKCVLALSESKAKGTDEEVRVQRLGVGHHPARDP